MVDLLSGQFTLRANSDTLLVKDTGLKIFLSWTLTGRFMVKFVKKYVYHIRTLPFKVDATSACVFEVFACGLINTNAELLSWQAAVATRAPAATPPKILAVRRAACIILRRRLLILTKKKKCAKFWKIWPSGTELLPQSECIELKKQNIYKNKQTKNLSIPGKDARECISSVLLLRPPVVQPFGAFLLQDTLCIFDIVQKWARMLKKLWDPL